MGTNLAYVPISDTKFQHCIWEDLPSRTESIASVVCTTSSEVSRLKYLSISTGEKVLLFRKKRNSQSNNRKKRYKENHKINFLTMKTKKNTWWDTKELYIKVPESV